MATLKDPTQPMREKASAMPSATEGSSCNQTSFKIGKKSFFFIGHGAKGQGYKARFKLERSIPQAEVLAPDKPVL